MNKWINNDKDYLKLAIEYKKRYLDWANKQRQQGRDTDIERFIKDEKLDPVEQEIVHALQQPVSDKQKKVNEDASKKTGARPIVKIKPIRKLKNTKEIPAVADKPSEVMADQKITLEKDAERLVEAEQTLLAINNPEVPGKNHTVISSNTKILQFLLLLIVVFVLVIFAVILLIKSRLSRIKVIA